MKKALFILSLALAVSSCGNHKTGSSQDNDTSVTTTNSTTKSTSVALKDTLGAALIQKNDCSTCHQANEKIVGPAYVDIANKYKASNAVIDTLANKIINGGSGNWGSMQMSSHPGLAVADAKEMVKYILSLKK